MPTPLAFGEFATRLRREPVATLREAVGRDETAPTPLTEGLVGLVTVAFLAQAVAGAALGGTTGGVAAYLFVEHPRVAWTVAPLLHRGPVHFAANAVLLLLLAPVERRLGTGEYLGLLATAGFLPLYLGGLVLAATSGGAPVAFYGISGFVLGLAGYGLVAVAAAGWRVGPAWWLVALVGVSAVVMVSLDLLTNTALGGLPHVGHLAGLLAGLAWGTVHRRPP